MRTLIAAMAALSAMALAAPPAFAQRGDNDRGRHERDDDNGRRGGDRDNRRGDGERRGDGQGGERRGDGQRDGERGGEQRRQRDDSGLAGGRGDDNRGREFRGRGGDDGRGRRGGDDNGGREWQGRGAGENDSDHNRRSRAGDNSAGREWQGRGGDNNAGREWRGRGGDNDGDRRGGEVRRDWNRGDDNDGRDRNRSEYDRNRGGGDRSWDRDGRGGDNDWSRRGRRDWQDDDNHRREWDRSRHDSRYSRYRHTHRDFDRPRYSDWRRVRHGYYFDDGYARIVRGYYGRNYFWWSYSGWHRPYRRWSIGYVIPYWLYWEPLPWDLYYMLPPAPYGCRYVYADGDILLVAIATGIILDALIYDGDYYDRY